MATIRTYNAPLDRIRPDDRGYAAQENAARRISAKTTDEATRLRAAGSLSADVIRMQAAYDRAIAPQAAPVGRGGGSGGGGSPRGGSPSQTAGPREAAQMAGTLGKILGGMGTNDSNLPRTHSYPRPSEYGYFDPLTGDPQAIRAAAGSPDFQETAFGRDRFTPPPVGERRAARNPLAEPDPYAYENPGGEALSGTYAPYNPPTADPIPLRLLNYLADYGAAIVSGFSAASGAAVGATSDLPSSEGYY